MTVNWTTTQASRLRELEVDETELDRVFTEIKERDRQYQQLEKRLVQASLKTT